MQNHIRLEFKPLYLRPLLETDLDEIHAIWINEHVRKYLFDDEVILKETALEEIENSISSFQQYKYGL